MGEFCVHVLRSNSPGPATLKSSQTRPLCRRCIDAGYRQGDINVLSQHEGLLRAAEVLLDHKELYDKDEIIPTLVLAANSDLSRAVFEGVVRPSIFENVASALVEDYGNDEAWEELEQAFFDSFLGMKPYKAVDGVAVVKRDRLTMSIKPDKTDWYEPYGGGELFDSVIIQVCEGQVEPSEVSELYLEILQLYSLPSAPGRMTFSSHSDSECLRIVVRPEEDPDLHPSLTYGSGVVLSPQGSLLKPQPAFPHPDDVAAFYRMLKENRHTPQKQERGPLPVPYNLIPAVVAWYLRGHTEYVHRARKAEVTRLVRAHLLDPRYPRIPRKEKLDLGRDLSKALPHILCAERAFVARLGFLRKYF